MAETENQEPKRSRLTEISDEPLTDKERTLFIVFGIVVAIGLLMTLIVVGVMSHSPSIAR